MIDGYILSKMTAIPVTLLPEIGNQIKFVDFYQKISNGRELPYPPVG